MPETHHITLQREAKSQKDLKVKDNFFADPASTIFEETIILPHHRSKLIESTQTMGITARRDANRIQDEIGSIQKPRYHAQEPAMD